MKPLRIYAGVLLVCLFLSGCSLGKKSSVGIIGGADGPTAIYVTAREENYGWSSISMDEAKNIFSTPGDYLIVDVRTNEEFEQGHIPGAINIPNETIDGEAPEELSDSEQVIYIYCRSGNRSKQASEKLAAIGYTNIIEFGGIIDWTGEIEK